MNEFIKMLQILIIVINVLLCLQLLRKIKRANYIIEHAAKLMLDYQIKLYNESWNPSLKFEELEEHTWYWDNYCKEYFTIDKIHKELKSLDINIDEESEVCEVKYYEENRFYHREVKV